MHPTIKMTITKLTTNMKTKNYELVASEFSWSISANKTIKAWGFNEMVPGPTLEAEKGDRIVVKVTNNLQEPTVIHWHGIQLAAGMDGTDSVQTPIAPGESFEYNFIVPDAGTFWYHSHQNEAVQMERGMYGALVVKDKDDVLTDGERVLMIDDMKLTSKNEFKQGNFISKWVERHDGREGSTLLINGLENNEIRMRAGQTERWRIINSSSARYFRLYLDGTPFKIISTDGGLIERPVEATDILLVPGERVDILVGPFAEGETFSIDSLPYNRMTFLKSRRNTFASVSVDKAAPSAFQIPKTMRAIAPLASQDATPNRNINFSVGASLKNGIDFLVNGETHASDKPVRIGELQIWEVSNTSLMDHPFHLHGFFFQVLEVNGKAPEFISWKDTVNLPPRSKVKIAWIPGNRPGSWMYHCHILEHHEAGMMGHFDVVGQDSSTANSHNGHHHQHHHLGAHG
jgi:FtsP/CotA-like multicopper oxidase with cupredoxin domain